MRSRNSRWDRYVLRFKNTWVGVLILVMVAVVTFLSTSTGFVDWVYNRFFAKADLVISPLDSGKRLLRLPGHPLIDRGAPEATVFTGGFRARLSLAHNQKTDAPINVRGVMLKVDEFTPGELPGYDYRVNLDEIIGRGITEARVFDVTLSGEKVSSAVWIDENGNPLSTKPENLLDVEPPRVLTLKNKTDIGEELDIRVTPDKPGLYKVRFVFDYSVSGKDHIQTSTPVLVYYKEEL
jgi:hypothetical protein